MSICFLRRVRKKECEFWCAETGEEDLRGVGRGKTTQGILYGKKLFSILKRKVEIRLEVIQREQINMRTVTVSGDGVANRRIRGSGVHSCGNRYSHTS